MLLSKMCTISLQIMTIVKLNKNRDLLDPNFSGYKLSLDSVAVTSTDVPPEAAVTHLNPSNDQYRSDKD